MEKIIEKVEVLKSYLNDTPQIQEIIKLNRKIKENKELLDKIEKYNQTRKEELKQEIYMIELFQEYKKAETELNILILEINAALKKINDKGKCKIWK